MDNGAAESDPYLELLARIESAVPNLTALEAAREQVNAADLPDKDRREHLAIVGCYRWAGKVRKYLW